MTVVLAQAKRPRRGGAKRQRRWLVGLARLVIFWERLWPALLPTAAPFFLILVLGLFNLWRHTPAWLHTAALAAAALATLAAAWRYGRHVAWPSRRQALARLEGDSALPHNPLQTLEDRPFGAQENPLWRAHLARAAAQAAQARPRGPRATADDVDPWALRFAAVGLLAVALTAAGPERGPRFAAAFTPGAALADAAGLADVWIEPPAYTGKAPIYLLRAGEPLAGVGAQINAPAGSQAIAQVAATRRARLELVTENGERKAGAADAGRLSLALDRSGLLRLKIAGAEGRWPIGLVSDDPPTASFIEPPQTTDDARLALAVAVDDDYGVVEARLEMRLDPDQERPIDAPDFDETSIRERRVVELDGFAGRSGERRFDLDLQSDPWAGLMVRAKIVVTDGADQTGETREVTARLPARPFYNPLARSVVEQRQTLAVATGAWRRAGRSFDALTLAPEEFYDRSSDYLMMRTAFWRVMREQGEDVGDTVEAFWPLALQLEDEALELARRRLEAAQEALRQALESGASDEEIERLVEELRAAMQQYLQAFAQSGERMSGGAPREGQTMNESDLQEMLDSIRNLAQSGARNAARQALSDLENILNNLRMSSSGSAGQPGGGEGQPGEGQGGAAGAAGDLIGRQRELANRSFERGQSFGATGDDLAGEQEGLAGELEALLDGLRSGAAGPDPTGEGAQALREARRNMEDAEAALRRDNFDAATTAMENAVASLRDGAEALAEAQSAETRQQMGQDGQPGPALDPLGRPIGDAYGRGVDVPEESEMQRARDVLEELRRRLSDGARDEDEINYLERLLNWF